MIVSHHVSQSELQNQIFAFDKLVNTAVSGTNNAQGNC